MAGTQNEQLTAAEVLRAVGDGAFGAAELRRIAVAVTKAQKRQLRQEFPLMSKARIVHGGRWGGVVGTVVKVNVTTVELSTDRGPVRVPIALLAAVESK